MCRRVIPLKLHSLADLCGHSAGSYRGHGLYRHAEEAVAACPAGKSIDVKQYPTIQNVFADLAAGRLDAAVDGSCRLTPSSRIPV